MSLLFNWKVWVAILIAIALAASHWKVYKVGQNEKQAEWNAEKLDTAQQTLRLLESRDRTTTALQDNADTLRRNKNAHIARLDADLAAALAGLQNRPDRPSDANLPTDTSAGPNPGCTGAQLFKPDAGFLVRESARADKLLADLGQCQAAYDSARKAVNGQ
jgi:small-conductance mechanosensitive channel